MRFLAIASPRDWSKVQTHFANYNLIGCHFLLYPNTYLYKIQESNKEKKESYSTIREANRSAKKLKFFIQQKLLTHLLN